MYLHAGPEVSVTSTKTFTATATVFALLALHLGRIHDLSPADGRRIIAGLRALPDQIAEILAMEEEIAGLAKELARYPGHVLRRPGPRLPGGQGRRAEAQGGLLPACGGLPGQRAQARPAGAGRPGAADRGDRAGRRAAGEEPGHARRDQGPARPGRSLVGHSVPDGTLADDVIAVPKNEPELDPILLSVPLQLLAYHAAVALGNDVDKPRNLAKSVTVE